MTATIACLQKEATAAGLEILRMGGNAVDAAVAAGFAECVVSPSLVSIGGVANLQIYHGPSREHLLLGGGGPAGSNAGPETFARDYVGRRDLVGRWEVKGYTNQMGYRSIAIPTFVGVIGEAHRRLGRLEWGALLQPAIRLATEGFVFNEYARRHWTEDGEVAVVPEADALTKLTLTDETARLFLTPDRQLYDAGDRMKLPDLARTLTIIANEGPRSFYEGEIAERMAADLGANGGLVTLEDLNGFQPKVSNEPYRGRYGQFEVATQLLPSTDLEMITMLQVIDGLALEDHDPNSVEYIDLVGRVMHEVFQDRVRYYADPDFVDVPVEWLASREHADELRARVLAGATASDRVDVRRASSYYAIVDDEGTAVAMTHSWGSGSGVASTGLGFVYNNMMGLFDPRSGRPESIAPGKRGVAGSGGAMLLADGKVRLVVGSPGGPRGTAAVLQSILNHHVFGMGLDEAIARPRFHTEEPAKMYLEDTYPLDVGDRLEGMGYRVTRWRYGGRVAIIAVDGDGTHRAAVDPRAAGEVGSTG